MAFPICCITSLGDVGCWKSCRVGYIECFNFIGFIRCPISFFSFDRIEVVYFRIQVLHVTSYFFCFRVQISSGHTTVTEYRFLDRCTGSVDFYVV
ncbi:hypothetical protein EVA_10387 [gut metagenome]|uniref:Uncharacterized protein n=1 Tax=gut metagenome TaxID=749906 RepID=J9GNM7_9ZZZZ